MGVISYSSMKTKKSSAMRRGLPKQVNTKSNINSPTEFIRKHLFLETILPNGKLVSQGYEYGFYGNAGNISKANGGRIIKNRISKKRTLMILNARRGFHTHNVNIRSNIFPSPGDLQAFISSKRQKLHGIIIPGKKGEVKGYVVLRKLSSKKLAARRHRLGRLLGQIESSKKRPEFKLAVKKLRANYPVIFETLNFAVNPPTLFPSETNIKNFKRELFSAGIQFRVVSNRKSGYHFDGEDFLRH